jgi:TolB-like protein
MNAMKMMCWVSLLIFLSACEVKMGPSEYWSKIFRTQSDSSYYKEKMESLIEAVSKNITDYEINKVAVMDLTDEMGEAPILGEYLASRIIEAVTNVKVFRVAQKGEVNQALIQLNLKPSYVYSKGELASLGKVLNSQAVLTGKITDLGTNLDVHVALTDVATGEVISSATENLNRTKFAVEMLRHH